MWVRNLKWLINGRWLSQCQLSFYSKKLELQCQVSSLLINIKGALWKQGTIWHYVPYRYLYSFVRWGSLWTLLSAESRNLERVSKKNKFFALGSSNERSVFEHSLLWQKKTFLDKCLYFYNNQLTSELISAANKLQSEVDIIKADGFPVILAPLHTVSDVVVGTLCSYIKADNILIISNHDYHSIGPEEEAKLKVQKMQLINPKHLSVTVLKKIIKKIKTHESVFVIYPDVPPEVTWKLSRKSMRTYDCSLFYRKARLHSGLAEMAKMAKAKVLFFCLHDQEGILDVEILGALSWDVITERSPDLIEQSIRRYSSQWLLWHTPSLFYFNSADR